MRGQGRPPARVDRVDRVDATLALLVALGCFVLYRSTAPAQVNLDGLGYLKLLPHNYSAGHLLYMPLLRATTALRHGDALDAGRLLDALCAAGAVALAFTCARAFADRAAALLGAAGLAVSYAVWVQGADVECYAPALLALMVLVALLCAARARPGIETTVGVGVALGVAVLTHLTHVLSVPLVVAWMLAFGAGSRARRLGHAAAALAVGGALAASCYAFAAFGVRHTDGAGLMRWVATAQHGFRYQGSVLSRLADSVYGLSRALVWSPYLYESNAQTLLGQFLLGLSVAAVLVALLVARARRGGHVGLPSWLLAAWAAPYAMMALVFFGSDHERWLFVLPPLWLAAGAALASSRRGVIAGTALVMMVGLINHATAIAPAVQWTWDRTRADAATEPMRDGDLVLFPGHSWDEYVGFHSGRRVVPLPLAYYAGVLGKAGCEARVMRDVRGARARGSRVWAVRLPAGDGGGDGGGDDRGLFELRQLGLGREELVRLLGRWRAVKVGTSQPEVTVLRLEERE